MSAAERIKEKKRLDFLSLAECAGDDFAREVFSSFSKETLNGWLANR